MIAQKKELKKHHRGEEKNKYSLSAMKGGGQAQLTLIPVNRHSTKGLP